MPRNFNVVPEETNSPLIKESKNSGFKYIERNVIRYSNNGAQNSRKLIKIKLDSQGKPEKYANGRNVILGEDGYPINNKGQYLSFNVKTGDLLKNSSGNPYVYNPYIGGFKVHPSEIKYRYPPSRPTELRNTAPSFFYAQGPAQTLEPAIFSPKRELPHVGFKEHNTTLKNNKKPAGTNESNNAHLFNNGKHKKKSGFFSLFSGLSLSGK
jgi:hypothetical protein